MQETIPLFKNKGDERSPLREWKKARVKGSIENFNKVGTQDIPGSNVKLDRETIRAQRFPSSHTKESLVHFVHRKIAFTEGLLKEKQKKKGYQGGDSAHQCW